MGSLFYQKLIVLSENTDCYAFSYFDFTIKLLYFFEFVFAISKHKPYGNKDLCLYIKLYKPYIFIRWNLNNLDIIKRSQINNV